MKYNLTLKCRDTKLYIKNQACYKRIFLCQSMLLHNTVGHIGAKIRKHFRLIHLAADYIPEPTAQIGHEY